MPRFRTDLSPVAISVAPSPATSGTSLGVTDANAAYLPDIYPYWAVLVPTGAAPNRTNAEIVKVTGGSSLAGTTTLTIVRAQGIPVTTAKTVTTGFDIYCANSVEANLGTNSLIYEETPSGTVNGSNTSFTLANTPVAGSVMLFRDGQLLVGGGADYTMTGGGISFVTAPVTGSILKAYYQYAVASSGNADTTDGAHSSSTPTANYMPVLTADALMPGETLALIQGALVNGQISVTVASNNLTVAIKTLAGNNPSTTSPVTVRIGNTIRKITAALSVTKNAGTNWCNAGGAELATKEVDYFVYLGYNSTDGVVLGFSRIPYAALYSDFSTTSTNERYAGISTITNASSGDNYENIGRFCATLSAGAGYTWSVPTFTNSNLIQKPVLETRTLDGVLTVKGSGGTVGTFAITTLNYRYKMADRSMYFTVTGYNITSKGSWSGDVFVVPPMLGIGSEYVSIPGAWGTIAIYGTTRALAFLKADGTIGFYTLGTGNLQWSTVATSDSFNIAGWYPIA